MFITYISQILAICEKEQCTALPIFFTLSGIYKYMFLLQEPMYNILAYYVHINHEKIKI